MYNEYFFLNRSYKILFLKLELVVFSYFISNASKDVIIIEPTLQCDYVAWQLLYNQYLNVQAMQ